MTAEKTKEEIKTNEVCDWLKQNYAAEFEFPNGEFSHVSRLFVANMITSFYDQQNAALIAELETARHSIRMLLPLAKGYAHQHSNVQSIQNIIQVADELITEALTTK